MADTYIISLLMCSIIAIIIAIGVFTLRTVRNEKRIEELEEIIDSLNQFRSLQQRTNRAQNESMEMLKARTEESGEIASEVSRRVSNILNRQLMKGDSNNG